MLLVTPQHSWLQTSGFSCGSIAMCPTAAAAECLVCPQHQLGSAVVVCGKRGGWWVWGTCEGLQRENPKRHTPGAWALPIY